VASTDTNSYTWFKSGKELQVYIAGSKNNAIKITFLGVQAK
jgi:hypothetical protein